MSELPLVFLGGLLGSAHCLGMCGGFAIMIGAPARGLRQNLARQIVYSAGRIFTYAVLGGALGYAGLRLADRLSGLINVQAALALVAGALLVAVGLVSAGLVPQKVVVATSRWLPWNRHAAHLGGAVTPGCLATGMLGTFLRAPGWGYVFLAGMLTGFLPCGLVYAFLALATSAGNPAAGMATMATFGLGTVPLMVLTGGAAALVTPAVRVRMLKVAAWCVVVTGIVSIARGVNAWELGPRDATPACPLCTEEASAEHSMAEQAVAP